MTTNSEYIIRAKNICKYFGAVTALENVDFELRKGEILGLVGDNGAGKSTLIKILSGAYRADKGSIQMYGKPVTIREPRDAEALGIETVYQNLALFDNLNFTQNIFVGREYIGKGFINKILNFADVKGMNHDALDRVSNISINLPNLEQKIGILSGGQRQAVAITRSIFWGKKVIIMDEPTASLGVQESAKVLSLIEETRNHVDGILLITHNIEHILQVADRVIVLRTGKRVGDIDCKKFEGTHGDLHNEIVKMITGAVVSVK